ncbi:MAG: 16S rRNA (guanine(966)-N(2))-methyltransferase RsmD [Gammaproteobacteria bacterium]
MAAQKRLKTKPRRPNQLRIIGGQWRGRRLSFPDVEGLRPTPDRVRETLFNWLAPIITGARCLDLYTGSGALGLEALSRGAVEVVMVDRDLQVIARLREHIQTLHANGAQLVQADALGYLRQREIPPSPPLQAPHPPPPFESPSLFPPFGKGGLGGIFQKGEPGGIFDIVFLDPPFGHNLLEPCCSLLEQHGWLAPNAYIYLESELESGLPTLPDNWRLKRSQKAGQVAYHLVVREQNTETQI